jgi:RNA polymerase sigma factor (sigma-70 family)
MIRRHDEIDPFGEEIWEESKVKNKYERRFKEITGYEFSRYYNEYYPKLSWYLTSRYTKDTDKSEDFANQAFMQALEKIETYDKEKSKLITWLTKIAINLVIKDWKDYHKRCHVSLERDSDDVPNIINTIKSEDDEEKLQVEKENNKKCEIVYDVINNLQDKYKKVMVMREVERKSYKDIADSIKKEKKINVSNEKINLENPEDFYKLDVTNHGKEDLILNFFSENGKEYSKRVKFGNTIIHRDEINWERNINNKLVIDSTLTNAVIVYTTTTNLSTIKSQIKKGRELIMKKVKKKFDLINEHGIDYKPLI